MTTETGNGGGPASTGETAAPESMRTRFLATFAARLIQTALSFVSAAVVPRSLGPKSYGDYGFLMNTAGSIRAFLEPSAEQGCCWQRVQQRGRGDGLTPHNPQAVAIFPPFCVGPERQRDPCGRRSPAPLRQLMLRAGGS